MDNTEKNLNKGMQKRASKIAKNAKKTHSIKEEQENICRFISFTFEEIKKVNGKWRHVGKSSMNGLQIKNKVYLQDGNYKLVNNKGFKIVKEYIEAPSWATEEMKELWNQFFKKA